MNDIIENFHRMYYDSKVWANTSWMGVKCLKSPLDLWIYQEIIWEKKPQLIVETGTFSGGSALYMAHLMDIVDRGSIVSVDLEVQPRPRHKRIRYVEGRSSVDEAVLAAIADIASSSSSTMVVLDSDHAKSHVLAEMQAYSRFVNPGSYLIVEDTNINGHPVLPDFGEGPWEAVAEFLSRNDCFEVDRSREKFLMTQNPNGFLRRVK
jgi:cephalosporin hydroxylase